MKCPFCQFNESKVTDTREAHEARSIRRRRECLGCNRRFTTFETIELSALQVKKRDGRFEEFSFEKLSNGLDKACRHTRISHDIAMEIASDIQSNLMQQSLGSIESCQLGDMVMAFLKERDEIAYIRFACEYRRFKDINELISAIEHVAPLEGKKVLGVNKTAI